MRETGGGGGSFHVARLFSFLQKEKDLCEYGSGIFLIRNPFHATVSEWQRQKSGDNHVGVLGQEYFGKYMLFS